MATGDELNQSLVPSSGTYTLTLQGRTAGGQTPEVIGSFVVGKKIDAVAAARRSAVDAADSTANLDAAGYVGSNNVDIGNSMHVGLSGRFSVAGASAVVFLALYDESDGFIGITRDFTLVGDPTFRESSSGKYPCPVEIIDTVCAAQVFPVVRSISSGNVDLYLEAL